ncbi:MAG: hypothetical protein WDN72_09685 [Alphaproteobacteria bacterium]
MITGDDLVLCLSNSGETHELRDVIAYTRRFDIPLAALVRRETSVLVARRHRHRAARHSRSLAHRRADDLDDDDARLR